MDSLVRCPYLLMVAALRGSSVFRSALGRPGRSIVTYDVPRPLHRQAESPWLWLAPKGQFTDSGIRRMIYRRCRQVGIKVIHPHQFRHTFGHKWLAAGGVTIEGGIDITIESVRDGDAGREAWRKLKAEMNRKLAAKGYPPAFPATTA